MATDMDAIAHTFTPAITTLATWQSMSDEIGDVVKKCRNPNCTGINPLKGKWCTARECKDLRALGTAAKKQHKMAAEGSGVRCRRRGCACCAAKRCWAVLRAALRAWRRGLRLSISQWEAAGEGATRRPEAVVLFGLWYVRYD